MYEFQIYTRGKEILIHYVSLKGIFQGHILIRLLKKKKNQTRKCIVCSKHKIRQESRYQCIECNVDLRFWL